MENTGKSSIVTSIIIVYHTPRPESRLPS